MSAPLLEAILLCNLHNFFRVVIESGVGGITPIDGPDGPSIIGSVDNVFKAVKDYDQFRCIEKMM